MKTKLILLPQPILVSDEEKQEGKWCLNPDGYPDIFGYDYRACYTKEQIDNCKMIIAGIHELPSIIYADEASKTLQERCGWVDVEKSILQFFEKEPNFNNYWKPLIKSNPSLIEAFKAAQSNEKKFSEEDLRMVAMRVWGNYEVIKTIDSIGNFLNEQVQSLSQPKVFDCLVEMEEVEYGHVDDYSKPHGFKIQPKITNNSIKLLKVL